MEQNNAINESKISYDEQAIELLTQIRDTSVKRAKYQKRASIFTMGIFVVLVVAVICAAPLVPHALNTLTQVDALTAQAQSSLRNVDAMSESITKTSESLNTLVDQNADSLTTSVQELSKIDFDGLNKAIADLQTAIEPLAQFGKMFK